jgi:hypothetical protein
MSFSAQWLKLREPHDLVARNESVIEAVVAAFAGRSSVGIVDLACGTGSTMRALSPHLPARQDWRLADNDLTLLTQAKQLPAPSAAKVATMAVDLARDVEMALDGPIDLITTSALLDLVSAEWLERLTVEAAARHLPIYAALSYDGRATLDPADARDSTIIAAVNRHQRGNKGFGPALGPDAAATAIERFASLGYTIVQGRSDWVLGPSDRAIQDHVVAGWAGAATEVQAWAGSENDGRKLAKIDIPDWLADRKKLIAAGASTIRVGHVDFFARPTGRR